MRCQYRFQLDQAVVQILETLFIMSITEDRIGNIPEKRYELSK